MRDPRHTRSGIPVPQQLPPRGRPAPLGGSRRGRRSRDRRAPGAGNNVAVGRRQHRDDRPPRGARVVRIRVIRDHHPDAPVGQFDHRADRVERQPHEMCRVVAVEQSRARPAAELRSARRGRRAPVGAGAVRSARRKRRRPRAIARAPGRSFRAARRVAGAVGPLVVRGDRGRERCDLREAAKDHLRPGLSVRVDHPPFVWASARRLAPGLPRESSSFRSRSRSAASDREQRVADPLGVEWGQPRDDLRDVDRVRGDEPRSAAEAPRLPGTQPWNRPPRERTAAAGRAAHRRAIPRPASRPRSDPTGAFGGHRRVNRRESIDAVGVGSSPRQRPLLHRESFLDHPEQTIEPVHCFNCADGESGKCLGEPHGGIEEPRPCPVVRRERVRSLAGECREERIGGERPLAIEQFAWRQGATGGRGRSVAVAAVLRPRPAARSVGGCWRKLSASDDDRNRFARLDRFGRRGCGALRAAVETR